MKHGPVNVPLPVEVAKNRTVVKANAFAQHGLLRLTEVVPPKHGLREVIKGVPRIRRVRDRVVVVLKSSPLNVIEVMRVDHQRVPFSCRGPGRSTKQTHRTFVFFRMQGGIPAALGLEVNDRLAPITDVVGFGGGCVVNTQRFAYARRHGSDIRRRFLKAQPNSRCETLVKRSTSSSVMWR